MNTWSRMAALATVCAAAHGVHAADRAAEQPALQTANLLSGAAAQALYGQWYVPHSQQVLDSATQLQADLQAYCAGKAPQAQVQKQLRQTTMQWEELSATSMGPLVQRRSARVVDFQPLRLNQLQSSMARAPQTLQDMEQVGGPAKGFPALEHLLWVDVAAPKTPACNYAVLAAGDVVQEFTALKADMHAAAQQAPLDFDSTADFLNQWLGGVERLRWASMEKPLRSSSANRPAQLVRGASKGTVANWRAQWQGLRALAVLPAPQQADMPTIARLVQARGWNTLANEVQEAVKQVDTAMAGIKGTTLEDVQPASRALQKLKHLVERDVALALDVTIGFSDADGD